MENKIQISVQIKIFGDILLDEVKSFALDVGNVRDITGYKVVHTDDFIPLIQKEFAQVGTILSCYAGEKGLFP